MKDDYRPITILSLCTLFMCLFACVDKKSSSPNVVDINKTKDTLRVNYTYWQSDSGPFTGLCGDKYTFAFLGKVESIEPLSKDTTSLYKSQKGTLIISEILKTTTQAKKEYQGQTYFSSDCFYDAALVPGDTVLVFCYMYENAISIPGGKSILKIDGLQDPALASIIRYIAAGEDPMAIKDDLTIWKKKGFDAALERIIECRQHMNTQN